jgi:hypothetical protein
MNKIILQSRISKHQGATLRVIQFQKGKYPRTQLTELHQIRVEPIYVRLEERTLMNVHYLKKNQTEQGN